MKSFSEMLKGDQHKIDKNKNGKIDAHDFKLLKKMKKEDIDHLAEKDDSEYDYEGEMAVTQLKTIMRHAEALQAKMQPDTNLPEWVQSKITLATDYMQTAHDYLMSELDEQAPVAPVPDRKYIKGTPENKAYKATKKPINGMPTNVKEEADQIDEKSEQAKKNKTMKNMMDASRGARYKLNNPVPDRDPEHKTAQAHNKAIGRALRKEEEELEEVAKATGDLKDACWKGYTAVGMKMKNGKKVPNCVPVKEESDLEEKIDMNKASMGDVITDFKKSDAPQFAGKSAEKRRQMAIAAKLQADRTKKEGVEMKSYKQFMEELVNKLPEEQVEEIEVNEEVEQIDELDIKLLKAMQKSAKENPRPPSDSDNARDSTGKLKPYGYRGKSEYEKSETGDDEPNKRGRKTGVTVGSYKRRQPK
jgi:hypothetical protein